MKRKFLLGLTFACFILSLTFAFGFGANITGFVVSDLEQAVSVNQIFSAAFLFLGLAIFVVGLLHD